MCEGASSTFLVISMRIHSLIPYQCTPSFDGRPYLLEEEETYEPPEDPDSGQHHLPCLMAFLIVENKGFSLEELGMRALQSLPRDRALDGIRAFNEMRLAGLLPCTGTPLADTISTGMILWRI